MLAVFFVSFVEKFKAASMYTGFGFGYGHSAYATHKLVLSAEVNKWLIRVMHANHFTRMRQLELASDKEHAHMCAWCSRMIAPDPNEKSANTQGRGTIPTYKKNANLDTVFLFRVYDIVLAISFLVLVMMIRAQRKVLKCKF